MLSEAQVPAKNISEDNWCLKLKDTKMKITLP